MEGEDNNNNDSVTDSGNDMRTRMRTKTKTRMMATRAVINYQEREKGDRGGGSMHAGEEAGNGRAQYY
jgi:hypothetical protein